MEENNNLHSVSGTPEHAALIFDVEIRSFLRETIRWSKFLAILGYIATAIIVLAGIGIMSFGSLMTDLMPDEIPYPGIGGFVGVLYILLGLLYYFPARYLYAFSVSTRVAIDHNDQKSMVKAFSRLKSFFKFWGVFMVIFLVFYALIFAFALIAGFSGLMLS